MQNRMTAITLRVGLLLSLILVLGLSPVVPAAKSNFISFDFPGSSDTEAAAITPSGEIVGRYISADGVKHGFILRGGVFTTIDVPGAFYTDIAWINARGNIVGTYFNDVGVHAFVLSRGVFTTIDFPTEHVNSTGFGISNARDVVGVEFVGSDFNSGHGYLFRRKEFSVIDFPGAKGTFPTMLIDPSHIVGSYLDTNFAYHGFFLRKGIFITIDFPSSTFTWITGVDPQGDLVGFYNDQGGQQHGFVLSNGKYTSIDIAGAIATEANGINPQGNVVGRYVTADGVTHAYLLAHF